MILVLTYHRIVASPENITGFFDVTAAELDSQLQRVKRVWGRAASPEDLLRSESSSAEGAGGVLITFDDGTSDHYTTAAPVLERNAMRGVFFVNTALLGKDGYLTIPQCQDLQARGHWIESHSHDHRRLSKFDRQGLQDQLAESRRRLRELNLGRWDFIAVPGGDFNPTIQDAAKAEGYALLRTLEWGYNREVSPFRIESITINRRTAGWWFGVLISSRFGWAKRGFYRFKERIKGGWLRRIYFGMRGAK
jgi:peptidoglycan/xylan/chitin deacetylase (PgdA/CDA1 family)